MVKTVTLYRSPVRLVKHAFEETDVYSAQAINRARKKLMAEIALSGDEIVIDDVPYSRNDASSLLDGISESDWKVHSVIYAHKGLLDFLEKEEFSDEEMKKADAYLYNTSFVHAVSPWFAHSFNLVSGQLLKEEDFDAGAKLLNYQGYILPEYNDEAYQKIRNWFDDLNYTLRNLSWEKFVADESILHFVFSDAWQRFINKLPSSFTTLRDETVSQLIAIVLRFQHQATWNYLHQVLVQLRAIETNEINRSEIKRIDDVIYQNTLIESGRKTRSKRRDSEFSSGRIIWWAVWIIMGIVRAATCNEHSNHYENDNRIYNLQNPPPEIPPSPQASPFPFITTKAKVENRNQNQLVHFLDSLSKKPALAQATSEGMRTGSQPFSSFAEDFIQSGTNLVNVTNNTEHDCVILWFDGPSRSGSVYEGGLPNTRAAFINRGETFSFNETPGNGTFYFLFGDNWGKLNKEAELPIYGQNTYSPNESRRFVLFVYEFFSNKKMLKQPYLQHGIRLDDDYAATKNESRYRYLNKPSQETKITTLALHEKSGDFSIDANGSLLVKEERKSVH